jgi:hypothetical protein
MADKFSDSVAAFAVEVGRYRLMVDALLTAAAARRRWRRTVFAVPGLAVAVQRRFHRWLQYGVKRRRDGVSFGYCRVGWVAVSADW